MLSARDFIQGQFQAATRASELPFVVAEGVDVAPLSMTGRWLVAQDEASEGRAPLRDKQLHRKFAQLRSEESILAFANRWGFLGFGLVSGSEEKVRAEPLSYWQSEVEKMADLIALWGISEDARRHVVRAELDLKRRVLWDDADQVRVAFHEFTEVPGGFTPIDRFVHVGKQPPLADRSGIATEAILEVIENKLDGDDYWGGCHCSICESERQTRLHERLDPDSRELGPPRLETLHPRLRAHLSKRGVMFEAIGLIAALYSLLAIEMLYGAGLAPTICRVCGEPFVARKRSAVTCGAACRQQLSRHRELY